MQQQESLENQQQTMPGNGNEDPGSYDTQMRVFHEQMKYMDSMQHANGETDRADKNGTNPKAYTKEFTPQNDTTFKPLPISATNAERQSTFNTVRNVEDDKNDIAAMIDQDVKATLGSRVRIRLLKDMNVGDYLIKKATYIYGVVTGFQKQRVNISIAQVLYNNTSLPVKIDLLDNDGSLVMS